MGIRASSLRLAVLSALVAACVGEEKYVYSARRYDPDADCLDPYSPVESVPGEGAGSRCPPSCLTTGGDVFVTTMCPPLPAIATAVPGSAEDCKAALAALAARRTCGGDTPDAAAGADSGADADANDGGEDEDASDAAGTRDAAEAG